MIFRALVISMVGAIAFVTGCSGLKSDGKESTKYKTDPWFDRVEQDLTFGADQEPGQIKLMVSSSSDVATYKIRIERVDSTYSTISYCRNGKDLEDSVLGTAVMPDRSISPGEYIEVLDAVELGHTYSYSLCVASYDSRFYEAHDIELIESK